MREYVEDREVTAWLLLDRSASMGFGPVDRQKDVGAGRGRHDASPRCSPAAATGSARCCSTTTVERPIPPGQGRNQVLRIASALLRRRPARRRRGTATDLSTGCCAGRARARPAPSLRGRHLGLHQPARLGAAAVAARPAARRRRHPGRRSARVRAARPSGMVYVEDAETGEQIFVDTDDPVFRERLRAAARRAAGRRCRPRPARPAPSCTRSGPTRTSSAPWPGSPSCAGGGGDELRVARGCCCRAAAGAAAGRRPTGAAAPARPAGGRAGRRTGWSRAAPAARRWRARRAGAAPRRR